MIQKHDIFIDFQSKQKLPEGNVARLQLKYES